MTPEERFWNRRRLAQTVTAIAALWSVVAVLTLLGGWRGSAAARAAVDWAAVPGTVTAVEVERVAQPGRVPFSVSAVRVVYAYSYGDRDYSSDRLRADGDLVSPQSAAGQAWLALSPGASVAVYVNPADPTQAALERGTTGRWLPNGLVLLALAGAAGVLSWVLGRRSRL